MFVGIVTAYHRRRARQRGVSEGHTGAVTAILATTNPIESTFSTVRGVSRTRSRAACGTPDEAPGLRR
jgi:hypothetical protein